MPLFDTFRSALQALAASVGGAQGLGALMAVHCRAGVAEDAQLLLDGALEASLPARRAAQSDAARAALLRCRGGRGAVCVGDRGSRGCRHTLTRTCPSPPLPPSPPPMCSGWTGAAVLDNPDDDDDDEGDDGDGAMGA